MSAHCDTCGQSLAWVGDEMWCDYCEVVAERDRLRADYLALWRDVAAAERIDTGSGDSAVSIALWSHAERYHALAEGEQA